MTTPQNEPGFAAPLSRRAALALGITIAGSSLAAGSTRPVYATPLLQATPSSLPADQAAAIVALARDAMAKQDVLGRHPARDDRRPGGRHRGPRRVDDRRPGHHRHALPQRRRRHLLHVHAPPPPRGPEGRPPGRPALQLAARPARRRPRHPAHAGQHDGRLPRLRAEPEVRPGALRRSLPPVDHRRS